MAFVEVCHAQAQVPGFIFSACCMSFGFSRSFLYESSTINMIPKILHYCWYGRGERPAVMQMCIESWRKHCPEYEIMEWNEDNTPMNIPWIKDAYMHQKYAFVADYMRFYILAKYGGVYMDTDMLLIGGIDKFLEHVFFIGLEDSYNVSFGILGCEKDHYIARRCLELYDSIKFDLVHPPIITRLITPIFNDQGRIEEDTTQFLRSSSICIYKSSVFYPIHYSQQFEIDDVLSYAKPDTVGIHLWNKSWKDEFQMFEAGNWELGFAEVNKRIKRTPFLPFAYWRKLIKYIGRYLGLWKR